MSLEFLLNVIGALIFLGTGFSVLVAISLSAVALMCPCAQKRLEDAAEDDDPELTAQALAARNEDGT